MPWKPVDPLKGEREARRRRAMELARPKSHARPYKTAAWRTARRLKLASHPQCEMCRAAPATEVDHINADPWDNRAGNLRSACKSCHSARTMRDLNRRRMGHDGSAGTRDADAAPPGDAPEDGGGSGSS